MAGGYSEQKHPPYYGGYQYPYPHIKFETPTAVKILFYGLIIMIIVQFLGLLATLIIYSFYTNQSFNEFRTDFFIFGILNSISSLLFWIFIILLVISVFVFHRGKLEFNQQHKKNIDWAKIFIIGYFILFAIAFIMTLFIIASMLFSEQYFQVPSFFTAISSSVAILQSFFLGFLILFLVKDIISPRDRDLLYIFAGLMVLLPLTNATTGMIESLLLAPGDSGFGVDVSYGTAIIFDLCYLVIWLIATFAFFNISKGLKTLERTIPDKPDKFLPRPKAVSKYLYKFFSKPKVSIPTVLVIAIIIGAGVGASAQIAYDQAVEHAKENFEDVEYLPYQSHRSENGILSEGQNEFIEVNIHSNIIELEVNLYWVDEPDQGRRNNEPDVFTLQVDLNGESWSDTNQNPHGGEGEIGLSWYYEKEDLYYVDTAMIMITLETAGDQTGPIGLPISPYTIEDNSNEYFLEIYYVVMEVN